MPTTQTRTRLTTKPCSIFSNFFTADGNAAHLVDVFEGEKDGHAAYSQLVLWYEGDELTTETAEDVRSKLENIHLDTRNTASDYINDFQLYTKQLEELGESYTTSKTVHIFLNQILDPDYETTKELCIENKYKIEECVERVRAKERRLTRDKNLSRKKTISVRRTESATSEVMSIQDFSKYKNSEGYYSLPRDIWDRLDDRSQKDIKKFNGDLRKKRRRTNDSNSNNSGASISQRRTTTEDKNDNNPAPNKKLRTVQFKDDQDVKMTDDNNDQNKQSGQPEHNSNSITQRSNEVISFSIRDSSE